MGQFDLVHPTSSSVVNSSWIIPSDDLIQEQSYQIARGVRPLALLGHGPAEGDAMLAIMGKLKIMGDSGVIPFVLDRGDGVCDYGFAATAWAVDLYRWCAQGVTDPEVTKHQHRILGLLLGYNPREIAAYEDRGKGQLFFDTS